MLEHPAITYYNRHGFLPKQQHEQEQVLIGHCSNCDESIYEDGNGNDKVIRWEDYYFCDKDCLVEAFEENLLPFNAYHECF